MDPNSIIKLLRQQRRQINDSFTSNSNNIDFAKTNIDYNNNIINKQQYQKEMLNNNNNNNSTFLVPSGYGNNNNTATNRLVTSYPNDKAYYDNLKMATLEANKNQISCQNYNYRMEYSNNNNNNLNLINSAKNDSHLMNMKIQKRNEPNSSSQINYYQQHTNESMTRSASVKSAASDSGIGSTSPLSDCSDLCGSNPLNNNNNNNNSNNKRQYLYEKNKYNIIPNGLKTEEVIKQNYNNNDSISINDQIIGIRKRKSNDEMYQSNLYQQQMNTSLQYDKIYQANYQKYMSQSSQIPLMNQQQQQQQQNIQYQMNRYNNNQSNLNKNLNECSSSSNMYTLKPIHYNNYNLQSNNTPPQMPKHSNIQATTTFVQTNHSDPKNLNKCECNECNSIKYLKSSINSNQNNLSNNNNNNNKPYKIVCNCSDPKCTYNYEANLNYASVNQDHMNKQLLISNNKSFNSSITNHQDLLNKQSIYQKVDTCYVPNSVQHPQPLHPPLPPPPPPQPQPHSIPPAPTPIHQQICTCSECFKAKQKQSFHNQQLAYNNLYQTNNNNNNNIKNKLHLVSEPVTLSSSSMPIATTVSKSLLNEPHHHNKQMIQSKYKTYRVNQEQTVQFLEDEYNELIKNGVQITKLRNVFYENYCNENNPDNIIVLNDTNNNNNNEKKNETQINNSNINLIKQAKSNNYMSKDKEILFNNMATPPSKRNRNSADSLSSNSSSSFSSSSPSPSKDKKSPSIIVSPLMNETNNTASVATQPTSIVCLSVNNNLSDDENDFELGEVIKIDKLKNTANVEILENNTSPKIITDIASLEEMPVQLSKKILPIVTARIHDWLERCVEFSNEIKQKTQLNSNQIFELLNKAWPKLLLVYMIENSFDFCVTKMNNCNNKSEKDMNSSINTSKLPKEKDAIQLINLINKGYNFNLSSVEFDLLREIVLFKEGLFIFIYFFFF
jgi:hypothetical protein